MSAAWTLQDVPSLTGKRFLITGANSGVGYYAAVELARKGAVVLLACRDRAKGEAALQQLKIDAAGPESAANLAELILLDLASLASVHQVADDLLARGTAIDALINNAGVMAPVTRQQSQDGFELQFGTNVLGHFALTCRLLPLIRDRVITLSSIGHKQGRINFDDLQAVKIYNPMTTYYQSKLADLLFTLELERRLRAMGSTVISIGVHPGVAKTNLFKLGQGKGLFGLGEKIVHTALGMLFESAADGALPTIFAATSPDAKGGGYYGPQGFMEMRGADVGPAIISRRAQDTAVAQRLWSVCAELTGVDL